MSPSAAASVAGTEFFSEGIDQKLSTLRDDRLIPRSEPAYSGAFGSHPRDRASERVWLIPGHRVSGYTTPEGSFCFAFKGLTGGCLPAGSLSATEPIDLSTDYGPKMFRIYGLAMDGVNAISLRARGVTRPVLMGRNAFFLEDGSLGGTRGFAGTLIAHMQDGTTRRVPFSVGMSRLPRFLSLLPGAMPVGEYGGLAAAVRGPVRRSGGAGPAASHRAGSIPSSLRYRQRRELAGVAQW
jgi:hypothetical protein